MEKQRNNNKKYRTYEEYKIKMVILFLAFFLIYLNEYLNEIFSFSPHESNNTIKQK